MSWKTVLKNLGASDDVIAKIENPDDDFKPEQVATELQSSVVSRFKQTDDYIKLLEKETLAEQKKAMNIAQQKVRQALGLKGQEIGGETFEDFLTKAKEVYDKDSKKTAQEWTAEREQLQKMLEVSKKQIEETESKYKKELKDYQVKTALKTKAISLPLTSQDKALAAELLVNTVVGQYQIETDERGEIILKTETGGRVQDGNDFLTIEKAFATQAERLGILAKNNGGEPGDTGRRKAPTTEPGLKKTPGQMRAEQKNRIY